MIELFEHDIEEKTRYSSKGNQLKWNNGKYWYKADYAGYEGLAEYMVSRLLCFSSLSSNQGKSLYHSLTAVQKISMAVSINDIHSH